MYPCDESTLPDYVKKDEELYVTCSPYTEYQNEVSYSQAAGNKCTLDQRCEWIKRSDPNSTTCGDGIKGDFPSPEECDDGTKNGTADSICSADCKVKKCPEGQARSSNVNKGGSCVVMCDTSTIPNGDFEICDSEVNPGSSNQYSEISGSCYNYPNLAHCYYRQKNVCGDGLVE